MNVLSLSSPASIRKLLFCASILVSLSSCLGPKKINKWVDQHYKEDPSPAQSSSAAKGNESITITSPLTSPDDKLSDTKKQTSHLLPLIFYWQYDYKNSCTLNTKIPVNNFIATVTSYSSHKGLKQKLHGQRLQLSLDQVPNTFAVDDKGHLIWIIYAFGWDILTVQPEQKDMVVSYKLLATDGQEVKSGVIHIHDTNKGFSLKMLQSLKKKTKEYMGHYDEDITSMSKAAVDQLVTELAL